MQNEPVAIFGTLGALVGAVLSGVLYTYMPDMGGPLIDAIVALVVFIVPLLVGLWYARSKVTPLANPKTSSGVMLVPADEGPAV